MKSRRIFPSLEDLSEELLDRIVSCIDSLPSLAVLARVSNIFNRIALPHLYAHVSFNDANMSTGTKYLRPFTALMLEKPQLAVLVQSIRIRDSYTTGNPINRKTWESWPSDIDLRSVFASAVQPHGLPEDKSNRWIEILLDGINEAAILALLLPVLVNLQSMDIPFDTELQEDWDNDSRFISEMLQRALSIAVEGEPIFSKLVDVMLAGTDDTYPDDSDFLADCMCLPAIGRLYGFNRGDEDGDNKAGSAFEKLQPGSSSVELIELRHSKLKTSQLDLLLKAPKNLKTFIYEIGNLRAWATVNSSATQTALEYQKANLERLSLSHSEFYSFWNDEISPMRFSGFTALRHLRIAPVYLYGTEVLQLGEGDVVGRTGPLSQEEIYSTRQLLANALPGQLKTLAFIRCEDPSALRRVAASMDEVLNCGKFTRLVEVAIHTSMLEKTNDQLKACKMLPWKEVRFIVKVEKAARYDQGRAWGWNSDVEWG